MRNYLAAIQKWQSIWLIALTAGFIAVAIAQTRTSSDQDETARLQQKMIKGGAHLKKDLAGDGFVVTYWCSVEDDVLEDVAA